MLPKPTAVSIAKFSALVGETNPLADLLLQACKNILQHELSREEANKRGRLHPGRPRVGL